MYNSIMVKKKKTNSVLIIFYSNDNKIKLPIYEDNFISVDLENNAIRVIKPTMECNWVVSMKKFNLSMFLFEHMFFQKINFKGKGYKLTFKKKKKYLKFMFGHSHKNVMFFKNIKIKRVTKYKYIFKSKQYLFLWQTTKKICDVRPLNVYTKRGIRNTRQFVYKRKGKKSTYI